MSNASASENIGCATCMALAVIGFFGVIALWLLRPDPSVECIKAGGSWFADHCEKARK